MSSGRFDLALAQDNDPICVSHSRQPMRDHDGGTAFHNLIDRLLHKALRFAVQCARRLVQYENLRVVNDGPGNRDALTFAARQTQTAVADNGVELLRQCRDESVRVRDARRLFDHLIGDVLAAVPNVVSHGIVEQKAFLGDDSEHPAVLSLPDGAKAHTVDQDIAGLRVVQTENEIGER